MHYSVDSPVTIRALFYVGQHNQEKFGLGKGDPGVNLFSRKVLIQAKAKALLPDYLRFVKGVVDSEDIPLNISREFLQDSNLIRRIKGVLTKRVLKWFDDESKKDPKKYETFFNEFGAFLKEGIVTDFGSKEDLAKLLRFESSKLEAGSMTSLDDYISRMHPEQKEIYYLCAPSRALAEQSPYYEGFKAQDKEVTPFGVKVLKDLGVIFIFSS
jgi:HSP90 family molecular chaperone